MENENPADEVSQLSAVKARLENEKLRIEIEKLKRPSYKSFQNLVQLTSFFTTVGTFVFLVSTNYYSIKNDQLKNEAVKTDLLRKEIAIQQDSLLRSKLEADNLYRIIGLQQQLLERNVSKFKSDTTEFYSKQLKDQTHRQDYLIELLVLLQKYALKSDTSIVHYEHRHRG